MNGRALTLVLALCSVGCAAVADDMRRAESSYEQARYEDSLVRLRALEDDAGGMDAEMRARYFYLRGMAEYRLGHRADALHHLAVAREVAGERGDGLRAEWRQIMDRTLTELTPRGLTHLPPESTSTEGGDDGVASSEATSGGEAPEAPPSGS